MQQFEDKIGRRLYCAWTHRVNSLIHQPTVISGTAPRRTSAAFTPRCHRSGSPAVRRERGNSAGQSGERWCGLRCPPATAPAAPGPARTPAARSFFIVSLTVPSRLAARPSPTPSPTRIGEVVGTYCGRAPGALHSLRGCRLPDGPRCSDSPALRVPLRLSPEPCPSGGAVPLRASTSSRPRRALLSPPPRAPGGLRADVGAGRMESARRQQRLPRARLPAAPGRLLPAGLPRRAGGAGAAPRRGRGRQSGVPSPAWCWWWGGEARCPSHRSWALRAVKARRFKAPINGAWPCALPSLPSPRPGEVPPSSARVSGEKSHGDAGREAAGRGERSAG